MTMNFSLLTADRMTHVKIVGVALVAATVVTVVGLTARVGGDSGSVAAASKAQPTAVVKAGRPAISTSNGALVVR
jgi:hypothetical protein